MSFGNRMLGFSQGVSAGGPAVLALTEIQWCILHEAAFPATTTGGLTEAHAALPATGGWIILCNGQRAITTQVNINKPNVKIIGHQNSHLDFQIVGGALYGLNITNTGCELRDFRVTCDFGGAVAETTTDLIYGVDCHGFWAENVKFDTGPAAGRTVNLTTPNGFCIHNCEFSGARDDALWITGGINGNIANNFFHNNAGLNIFLDTSGGITDPNDNIITGNLIQDPSDHAIRCNNADKVIVANNQIMYGVTAATFGIYLNNCDYAQARGNTVYDWNAAANMYGIAVDACLYSVVADNIVYQTTGYGIALYGISSFSSVLGNIVIQAAASGILIQDSNIVTISGNNVSGGITANTNGILVQTSGYCIVESNEITTWTGNVNMCGIYLTDGTNGIIANNLVGVTSSHGIVLEDDGGVDPDDCTISGNTINTPSGDGIRTADADRVQVIGNKILNGVTATTYGIYCDNSDYAVVNSNMIWNWDAAATMIGIYLLNGSYAAVNGNTVIDCSAQAIAIAVNPTASVCGNVTYRGGTAGTAGIYINASAGSTIANNLIQDPTGAGIYLLNLLHCTITGNYVWSPSTHGIWLTAADYCTIVGNRLTAMTSYGILVAEGSEFCVVSSNDIMGCGVDGIGLSNTQGDIVSNNFISTINGRGISLVTNTQDPDDVLINGNLIHTVSSHGIYCENADRLQVLNNKILNGVTATTHGIYAVNCDYGIIMGNLIDNWDAAATMTGIYWTDGQRGKIIDNFVNLASGNGITLQNDGGTSSLYCGVISNTVTYCGIDGIFGDAAKEGVISNNFVGFSTGVAGGIAAINWQDCDVSLISNNFIWDYNALALVNGINVTLSGETSVIGNYVYNTSGTGIVGTGINQVYVGNYVRLANVAAIYGIAPQSSVDLVVGNYITASGVSPAGGIYLSTQGYHSSIIGNVIIGLAVGITSGRSTHFCTISSNMIYNCTSSGIYLPGGYANVICSNIIDTITNGYGILFNTSVDDPDDNIICWNIINNITGNHGISMVNADRCQIIGNKILNGVTVSTYGIYASNCDYSMIQNNLIDNWDAAATMDGIRWYGGQWGIISGNLINAVSGYGIYALPDATPTDPDDLTIEDNIIRATTLNGITLVGGDRVRIRDNSILSGVGVATIAIRLTTCNYYLVDGNLINNWNSVGIYLSDCVKGSVSFNSISIVTAYGIWADDSLAAIDPDDAIVSYNTIDQTGDSAIRLEEADRAQVDSNHILTGPNAVAPAINVFDSDYIKIRSNLVEDWDQNAAADGIIVQNMDHGDISGNTLMNIGCRGIAVLVASSHSLISNNVIYICGSSGIEAVTSHYLSVIGNEIHDGRGNGTYGVRVEDSNWPKVNNNTIAEWDANNACDGISVHDCTFFQVNSNVIDDVGRDGVRVESTGAGSSIDGLINGNLVSNAAGDGVYLVDNVQQTDVVNNHCRGLAITMGAGVGNQNDWGSGHNLNRV